jgi:3-dehydroquinate synthetase/shikimate kinase
MLSMSDGIVLVGLPGSGKQTVGRLVAQYLDRPFIDIDGEVERATGRTPADHIERDGEGAFRELERKAVRSACATSGAIIATGGGAPLDPLNRFAFAGHGLRVRLDVPIERLAERVTADSISRPLLGPDPLGGLRRTEQARAPVYAAVDVTVDADRPAADVARAVAALATNGRHSDPGWRVLLDTRYARHHVIGPRSGRLVMGRGLTAVALEEQLAVFGGRAPAVVVDRKALEAHAGLNAALPEGLRLMVAGGERLKRMAHVERIVAWMSERHVERGDPLLAAGGGTVGDVAGLAAALYRRGMPLVQIPTTWLAQADSALGGKVAVNLGRAKNAVGAFWPAWLTVVDADLSDSLPVARRRDGLAECLKMGLIGDPSLWRLVEERGHEALHGRDPAAAYAITERAVRLKLEIVDRDPHEQGERRVLNLGHTLGHALEAESNYRLAHGDAVALGLRATAEIASHRGAEPGLAARIDEVLVRLGFPLRRPFDRSVVVRALSTDKKRQHGTQRWILPFDVGRVQEADDVSNHELELALDAIASDT